MIEVSVPGALVLAAPTREGHSYYIAAKSLMTITDRQREFMRSREWERAEMEGRPLSREEIRERSGYGEAQRLLDDRKQKHLN